jgi:hypothetical protein
MNDSDFDAALVKAVLALAGERGWRMASVVEAARSGGLDLGRARLRFPSKLVVLLRFGTMADQAALAGAPTEGPVKDRLFDMIMRRFDMLQAHRAGVLAVLDAAALDPALGLFLGRLSARSMGWLLEAAGISASGLRQIACPGASRRLALGDAGLAGGRERRSRGDDDGDGYGARPGWAVGPLHR